MVALLGMLTSISNALSAKKALFSLKHCHFKKYGNSVGRPVGLYDTYVELIYKIYIS
jgi:hypothetical protein